MHGIGPTLGDHIYIPAQSAPKLGLPSGSDYLILMDHIETVEDAAESRGIVIGGKAVHDEVIGKVSLTADGDALSWHSRGLREQLCARSVGRRHTGNQQSKVQEVA